MWLPGNSTGTKLGNPREVSESMLLLSNMVAFFGPTMNPDRLRDSDSRYITVLYMYITVLYMYITVLYMDMYLCIYIYDYIVQYICRS